MGNLLILFANNLLPIFFAAGTGFVLARYTSLETRTLSKLVFYIFSPCLIFDLLTTSDLNPEALLSMAGFALSHIAVIGLIAWGATRLFKLSRTMSVAIILAALLPNAGNFGLSVNLFAFGAEGLAYASVYFITSGMVANTIGVYIASLGRSDYLESLKGLAKIPTIYAVVFALIITQFNWVIPLPIARTTTTLGNAAIPGMLVLLGMLLQGAQIRGRIKELALANTLRLVISPLVAFAIAAAFQLQGTAYQAGMLEASMPAAVMTTVLNTEFEVEPDFATAIVFATTLLSPLTLTPLLAFLS